MSSGSDSEWIEEDSASENEIGGAHDDQEDAEMPIEDDGGFVALLNDPQPVDAVVLNACDRGFGMVKRNMARASCWNMETIVAAVDRAASTVTAINLDDTQQPFWSFKSFFEKRYKKLQGIQKYQLFRIVHDRPGEVECRRTPTSEGTWVNLVRGNVGEDDAAPDMSKFAAAWSAIPKAVDPPLNAEKMADVHKKILPYVPAQYATDAIYQKPSDQVELAAREIKRARRVKADAKRKQKK
jgi:hypothetical protein